MTIRYAPAIGATAVVGSGWTPQDLQDALNASGVAAPFQAAVFVSADGTQVLVQLPGRGDYWLQPGVAYRFVFIPSGERVVVVGGDDWPSGDFFDDGEG